MVIFIDRIKYQCLISQLENFPHIVFTFRSQRDGMETFFSHGVLSQDSLPQWRCVTWSEDETLVAASHSSGAVLIFDVVGGLPLFTIPGVSQANDLEIFLCDTDIL